MRWSESEYALYQQAQKRRSHVESATTEAQFQAEVIKLARACGLVCYHTHDSRHSAAGFPDLCIVDPRPLGYVGPGGSTQASPDGTIRGMSDVLLVELKTARGKLTREQELWLRALDGKRVVAQVWRPADLPAIVARLKGEEL